MAGFAVDIEAWPAEEKSRRQAENAVALGLRVPLVVARAWSRALPARYPAHYRSAAEAEAWVAELRGLGVRATVVPVEVATAACVEHPWLPRHLACGGCGAPICALCVAASPPAGLCVKCRAKRARSRRFFLVRVSILLTILAGVLLYALRDVRKRELRTDWARTLRVALVLVPLDPLEPRTEAALRVRLGALEQRLAEEMQRYRDGVRPFSVEIVVATTGSPPPPRPPASDDWLDTLAFNWELSRWVDRVDERARYDPARFDARIYLAAARGDGTTLTVEGTGQEGGHIGVVEIDLAPSMVDVALFVAAHELFHILGATDKYAPDGGVLVPDGLPEPNRSPLFPQPKAEVMARHRAVSASESVLPATLDELAVGPATAREIRWLHAPEP